MVSVVEELQREVTAWDYVCIAGRVALLPPYLIFKLSAKPFTSHTRRKPWRRLLGDAVFRYFCGMNLRRLIFVMGTTQWVYTTWAKWYKLPVTITELNDDARLLWIGPERTDKVILYFHGGGYVVPMQHFTASFWRYVQVELKKRGIQVGVATLNYSLVSAEPFPAQLRQAVSSVKYLISRGTRPEDIHIVGDSAGGNLVLALLSHILHPLDGIPHITPGQPFAGMYMMSPWVQLSSHTPSHFRNNRSDVFTLPLIEILASAVLEGVPQSMTPYLQPSLAREGWFNGAQEYVARFLITVGDRECFHDDVTEFASRFCQENVETRFLSQPDGVHNDPYFDFFVPQPKLGILTPIIIDWLTEGFSRELAN